MIFDDWVKFPPHLDEYVPFVLEIHGYKHRHAQKEIKIDHDVMFVQLTYDPELAEVFTTGMSLSTTLTSALLILTW